MALGFTMVKVMPKNVQYRWRLVDVVMDTDYPSGGWSLTAANFKLNHIAAVIPLGQEDGYYPVWDRSASKLMMYEAGADAAPLDECAVGENNLENKIVTLLVFGT